MVEVPKGLRRALNFVFVDSMDQVLPVALRDDIVDDTLVSRAMQ